MVLERPRSSVATVMGLSIKHVSLFALIFQNSALILFMHYSRVMPLVTGQRYLPSTAVLLAETMKLALSLTMALHDISRKQPNISTVALITTLADSIVLGDSWKLAIPATLFTLQSSLHYVAVSYLGAATFQVTNELKILVTALFSVLLLGRKITTKQWTALFLLTAGVAIVLIPIEDMAEDFKALTEHSHFSWMTPHTLDDLKNLVKSRRMIGEPLTRRSPDDEAVHGGAALRHHSLDSSIGFVAAIIACVSSGLASVVFEKILKDQRTKSVSIWVRNIQLSIYSLVPAFFIGVLFKDGETIRRHGFFTGYNWIVWITVILQAAGGIIVALVINYANSVAKNFATSISILVSSIISILFLDMEVTFHYILGTAIVLAATYLYANERGIAPSKPKVRPPHPVITSGISRAARSYENLSVATPRLQQSSSYANLFDIERVGSPFKNDWAITTSRPGTPTIDSDRHHYRLASARATFDKRVE